VPRRKLAAIAATTLSLTVVLAGCSSTSDTPSMDISPSATEIAPSAEATPVPERTNYGDNPAEGMVDPVTQNGASLNAVRGATGFIDTGSYPDGTAFLLETSDPSVVEVSLIDSPAPNYLAVSQGTATLSFYAQQGTINKNIAPTMTFTLTVPEDRGDNPANYNRLIVDPETQNGVSLTALVGEVGYTVTGGLREYPADTEFLIETSDPSVVEVIQATLKNKQYPTYVAVAPGTATINLYAGFQDQGAEPIMTFTVTVVAG